MGAPLKTLFNSLVTGFLSIALAGPAAFAQESGDEAFEDETSAPVESTASFSRQELDQMLAPIALYPDSLLSQILMAATFPDEVEEAAAWSRLNPHLRGEDAVRAVGSMDWDPSVKSLVAFPQVLARMDENHEWTERLGRAFIVLEPQVMEAIQGLRERAAAAGNLQSNERMQVAQEGGQIEIAPVSPGVVYVPYYDPAVVYGPWWWPAYPPAAWAPWDGYYASSPYAPAYLWGSGIVIGAGFFFGHFDWPHRQVLIVRHHPAEVIVNHGTTIIHRSRVDHVPFRSRHDFRHRRGFSHSPVRSHDSRRGHALSFDRGRSPSASGNSQHFGRRDSRSSRSFTDRRHARPPVIDHSRSVESRSIQRPIVSPFPVHPRIDRGPTLRLRDRNRASPHAGEARRPHHFRSGTHGVRVPGASFTPRVGVREDRSRHFGGMRGHGAGRHAGHGRAAASGRSGGGHGLSHRRAR